MFDILGMPDSGSCLRLILNCVYEHCADNATMCHNLGRNEGTVEENRPPTDKLKSAVSTLCVLPPTPCSCCFFCIFAFFLHFFWRKHERWLTCVHLSIFEKCVSGGGGITIVKSYLWSGGEKKGKRYTLCFIKCLHFYLIHSLQGNQSCHRPTGVGPKRLYQGIANRLIILNDSKGNTPFHKEQSHGE